MLTSVNSNPHVATLVKNENLLKLGGSVVLAYAIKRLYDHMCMAPFQGPREGIMGPKVERLGPEALEEIFLKHTDLKFGPVSFRIAGVLVVLQGLGSDIRTNFFQKRNCFLRPALFNVAFDSKAGCPGIFTATGDEWKRQKRAIAPYFNAANVKELLPLLHAKTSTLMHKFKRLSTVVDVTKECKYCTTDVVCEAALGLPFNYIEEADANGAEVSVQMRLYTLLQQRFCDSTRRVLRNGTLTALASACPQWLASGLSETIRTLYKRRDEYREVVDGILKEKLSAIKADPSKAKQRCLLDQALLQMLKNDDLQAVGEDQVLGTLNSNFATLFMAGSETSSNTASWLWYYLCCHPEWQRRSRAELAQVLGGREWRELSYAELQQLSVLRACMYECIRLCPTTPSIDSVVNSDEYAIDGTPIPRGAVMVNLTRVATTVASGLDDPLAFNPERWLDSAGKLRSEHEVGAGTLMFGGGPRVCPGRQLAEAEIVVMTVGALATFNSWTLLQRPEQVTRVDVLTVAPGPLSIRFEGVEQAVLSHTEVAEKAAIPRFEQLLGAARTRSPRSAGRRLTGASPWASELQS